MLTPIITPPADVHWTTTAPAQKLSGTDADFTGEYSRSPISYISPLNIPAVSMRVYPAFKPQFSHLFIQLTVEIEAIFTAADWISFATFSVDGVGSRVLTFNVTSTTGYHFSHTLDQNSNVNDYLKPMPYTFGNVLNVEIDVIAGGTCNAWVNSELVATARFLGVNSVYLTHYGLYTSPTTQYLKIRNYNLTEYAVT